MKIFPIKSQSRVLPTEVKNNLQLVLKNMEEKRYYKLSPEGYSFEQDVISKCVLGEKPLRALKKNMLKSDVEIHHNKRVYDVNPETGEIKCSCNILTRLEPAKRAIKKVSDIINAVKENFDNPNIVKQTSVRIFGLTDKGAKRIEEAQKTVLKG